MKLARLFQNSQGKIDKNLIKAFHDMAKLKLDQIEDADIIEMEPKQALKDKRRGGVYFYFTQNEKENPYSPSVKYRTIPGNTLLAITDGRNKMYRVDYRGWEDKHVLSGDANAYNSAGIEKSNSSVDGTGLTNMKRISEVADVAYVIDTNALRDRYDATR